jgi:alkyldihydroxyacetonephosphate synthase
VRREQKFWGWGEPGAGPALPDHAAGLLREWLGVSGAVVSSPVALDGVRLRAPAVSSALRAALERAVGAEHVRDDREIRVLRAAGKSYVDLLRQREGACGDAPDVVVAPADHGQVEAVLRACAAAGAAVIPFGGGTSVVGGVAPLRGRWETAVCLDLGRLDAVLEVDTRSRLARVGAGLRLPELDHALGADGLRLGHVPQSYEWATAGGCAATRSAGQASTGFGRFDELVAAVRCATPAGELATLGLAGSAAGPDLRALRVPASAAGPDLRALRVPASAAGPDLRALGVPASAAGPDPRALVLGSEGTLGAITELVLRVRPVAAEQRYEAWLLRSFEAGCDALRALAQAELAPDAARLSDEDETRTTLALAGERGLVRRAARAALRYRPGCLLVAGWEGEPEGVARRRAPAARLLRSAGALPLGRRPGDAWRAARFAGPHLRDALLDRGVLVETLETATTWTALAGLHGAVRGALERALRATPPVVGCHVSHLYPDGASLYFTVMARQDPDDPAGQWGAAKRAAGDAIAASGATITHHHAIGRDHTAWLEAEHGALVIELLRAVKERCDPEGIMNPGKLLPDRAPAI